MRKKVLSLALALVMCLGLTVPAFAVASDWKLEVPSKTDAEVLLDERTFTVRDWDSDPNSGDMTRTDSRQWTVENVYVLSKGDTAVITSGEPFMHLGFSVWSDPDGDGVYDSRLMDVSSGEILPANVAEPVRFGPIYSEETGEEIDWSGPYANDLNLYFSSDGEAWVDAGGGMVPEITRGQVSADYLLEAFGPNTLVRIEWKDWSCAILVEGNTTQPTVPTVGGFTDVKKTDWFAEPVLWAVEKNITAGTSDTTFSPNADCTTAQILSFLWRANGSPKPTMVNPFSDVKSGDWYADAAAWAYEKGLVSGTAFGGDTLCTRSMAVTYMWKAAGSPSARAASFTDVSAGAEYADAVAWAVEQGVTAGTSATTFSPDSVCTRGQIVSFLYRGLEK
jgi:hypothetical protein